ncbi:MAG: hypothetical protein V4471_04460 [Pseudomonadota bacterium]
MKFVSIKTTFDAYSRPIVVCTPLHLCVLQLEHGEKINNIDLGDAAHWLVSTSLIGSAENGSYQISVKPKHINPYWLIANRNV